MTLTAGDIDDLKTIPPGCYVFRAVNQGGRTTPVHLQGSEVQLFCARNEAKEPPMLIYRALAGVHLDQLLDAVLRHEHEYHKPQGHPL